jgi:hypothetical protein
VWQSPTLLGVVLQRGAQANRELSATTSSRSFAVIAGYQSNSLSWLGATEGLPDVSPKGCLEGAQMVPLGFQRGASRVPRWCL